MTYDLDNDESYLIKVLTPYPKLFPPEYDNNLNYLASLKLAARHHSGWTKGSEHQQALNRLKSLQPPKIKQCVGCGQ